MYATDSEHDWKDYVISSAIRPYLVCINVDVNYWATMNMKFLKISWNIMKKEGVIFIFSYMQEKKMFLPT